MPTLTLFLSRNTNKSALNRNISTLSIEMVKDGHITNTLKQRLLTKDIIRLNILNDMIEQ